MKLLLKYFFEGLLFLVPMAVTVYIVTWIFSTVDGLIPAPIPGVGFFLTLLIIICIGFLASNVFTKSFLNLIEKIFAKVPLVKLLYSTVKDLIGAFVGDKKSFDKPVIVTLFPQGTAKAIGFITKESLEPFGLNDHVAVYFPQSYNFAGNLLIFPKEQITPLDKDSSEVMAFIVSAGVTGK